VKLSPNGDFEGCEPLRWWTNESSVTSLPDFVYDHLESPDKVLVRPASLNMPFTEFIKRLKETGHKNSTISYYLEYLSMSTYVPDLERDVPLFEWAKWLNLEARNLWFGDGKSVSIFSFQNLLTNFFGTNSQHKLTN